MMSVFCPASFDQPRSGSRPTRFAGSSPAAAHTESEARTRIGEVMAEIADTPARTPLGLAVQLRRAQSAIEHDDRELAAHLVARAVVSCEGMAVDEISGGSLNTEAPRLPASAQVALEAI